MKNGKEFVYVEGIGKDGKLVPSNSRVGSTDPSQKGIPKHLRPTKNKDCKQKLCQEQFKRNLRRPRQLASSTPTTGTLRNLVIPMKWADHVNRTLPTRENLDILMNHNGSHALCPTGSVRDVFLTNSYGALTLESTVVDWVLIDGSEKFYANGDSG